MSSHLRYGNDVIFNEHLPDTTHVVCLITDSAEITDLFVRSCGIGQSDDVE